MENLTEIIQRLEPLFKLCSELDDMKTRRRISQSSSISFIDLISSQIKDEMVSMMHTLMCEVEDKIKASNLKIEELSRMLYEESRLRKSCFALVEDDVRINSVSISSLKQSNSELVESFEKLRIQMTDKVPYFKLDEVNKRMEGLVGRNEFSEVSSDLQNCVTFNEFKELSKDVDHITDNMKTLVSKPELADELDYNNKKTLEEHKLVFSMKKDVESINKTNLQEINVLKQSVSALNTTLGSKEMILKERIDAVANRIKQEPWNADIRKLECQVYTKAEFDDFYELEKKLKGKVRTQKKIITELNAKIESFGTIIERFDEIILDKASKDDVNFIKDQIPSFLDASRFESCYSDIQENFNENNGNIQDLQEKASDFTRNMNNLMNKFEAMKRENYEISNFHKILTHLKEEITGKAEKIDVFAIYDVMERRGEAAKLKEELGVIKDQLEMTIVLNNELCKTLLMKGEAQNVLMKQRNEIYKNLGNLYNWVHSKHQTTDNTNELPPILDKSKTSFLTF